MQPLSNKTTPLWDDSKEELKANKRSNRQQAKLDIDQEIKFNMHEVRHEEDYMLGLESLDELLLLN